MPIQEIICRHVRIPLKRPVKHASYERHDTDSLVVSCRMQDGTVGWGESLPRSYVTGETVDSAFEQFRQTDWRNAVAGPIESLPDAVAAVDGLQFAPTIDDARDCFGNALKCALELSILDAVCRKLDTPLSRVADHVPEAREVIHPRSRIQYSGAVTSASIRTTRLVSWAYRLTGFRHCKVKVGVAGVDDVALLRRVRRGLGPAIQLRIDANEAWHCDELADRIGPLLPFDIVSVEQPVPHSEVAGLADVRPTLGVPLMLDESLCSRGDAERAVQNGWCDYFNIRLSKCGGFVDSLRLATFAKASGLGFQLGCQVGETGLLSAAGRHFATTVDGWLAAEGSYDRHLVRERLTVEDLTFSWGGWARALTGPGLGVTVDEDAVRRVTIDEVAAQF